MAINYGNDMWVMGPTGAHPELQSQPYGDDVRPLDRRRRLLQRPPGGGLRALAGAEPSEEFPLSREPLRGGELSRPPELEKPAPLSTEAVPRTGAMLESTPLLGPRERAGAAVAEAFRGEEGDLPTPAGPAPGLSSKARNQALMGFFRPSRPPSESGQLPEAEQGIEGDVFKIGKIAAQRGIKEGLPRLFGGETGSFARSPEIEPAFQAQRAGERADLSGLAGGAAFPVAGAPLLSEIGAGGAPPSDVFNPNVIGGTGTTGAAGAGSLAANEAARASLMAGTSASAGGSMGGLSALAGAMPLLEIGPRQGIQLALDPNAFGGKAPTHSWQQRYPTGAEAGIVPFVGSILQPLISILGRTGIFGQHRSRSAALKAEAVEAGKIGDTMRGSIPQVNAARDLNEFFDAIQGLHLGLRQTPSDFTQAALEDPSRIWAASAPGGQWGEQSAMGVRSGLLTSDVKLGFEAAVTKLRQLVNENPALLDQLPEIDARIRAQAARAAEGAAQAGRRQAETFGEPFQGQTFG